MTIEFNKIAATKEMQDLRKLLERTGKEFLLKAINIQEVENETETPDSNWENVTCFVINGSLMVYPATVTIPSIEGETRVWGFIIEKIITYPGSHYEPPSEDYAEVGKYRSSVETAQVVVKLLVDMYFEYLSDDLCSESQYKAFLEKEGDVQ